MAKLEVDNKFAKLTIGEVTIFFSYETPIAYVENGFVVIRQNDWGATTGKHLNRVNTDKKIRISGEQFEKALSCLIAAGCK